MARSAQPSIKWEFQRDTLPTMKLTEENADGMDCRLLIDKPTMGSQALRDRVAAAARAARVAAGYPAEDSPWIEPAGATCPLGDSSGPGAQCPSSAAKNADRAASGKATE